MSTPLWRLACLVGIGYMLIGVLDYAGMNTPTQLALLPAYAGIATCYLGLLGRKRPQAAKYFSLMSIAIVIAELFGATFTLPIQLYRGEQRTILAAAALALISAIYLHRTISELIQIQVIEKFHKQADLFDRMIAMKKTKDPFNL